MFIFVKGHFTISKSIYDYNFWTSLKTTALCVHRKYAKRRN